MMDEKSAYTLLDQEERSGFQAGVHLGFIQISGWCGQKHAPALPFLPAPQFGFCAKALEVFWLNRGRRSPRRLPEVDVHRSRALGA